MNVLTAAAAADQLTTDRQQIYKLIAAGKLLAFDVSREADQRARWRIRQSDLDDFVASRMSSLIMCPTPEV